MRMCKRKNRMAQFGDVHPASKFREETPKKGPQSGRLFRCRPVASSKPILNAAGIHAALASDAAPGFASMQAAMKSLAVSLPSVAASILRASSKLG